jgi:hypothetical protein
MVYFLPKIPTWVNFGGPRNGKCCMAICIILGPFGLFCGQVVYFSRFGILYHEKSGNPAQHRESRVLFVRLNF